MPELTPESLGLETTNTPEGVPPVVDSPETTQDETEPSSTPQLDKTTGEKEVEASTTETPEVPQPNLYTDEEFQQAVISGSFDRSRLAPSQEAAMKFFQADYTKKTQSLAEEKRVLEEEKERLNQEHLQKTDPKEALYQKFLKNPMAVIRDINLTIDSFEDKLADDPYNADAKKSLRDVRKLKDELVYRSQEEQRMTTENTAIVNKAQTEIIKSIPDFEEKRSSLEEFAVNQGIAIEDIQLLTDSIFWAQVERMGIKGASAIPIRITKAINSLYSQLIAGKTAEKKINKSPPTPAGKPGSRGEKISTVDDLDKLAYPDYVKKRGG